MASYTVYRVLEYISIRIVYISMFHHIKTKLL